MFRGWNHAAITVAFARAARLLRRLLPRGVSRWSLRVRIVSLITGLAFVIVAALSALFLRAFLDSVAQDVVERAEIALSQVEGLLSHRVTELTLQAGEQPLSLEAALDLWSQLLRHDNEFHDLLTRTLASTRGVVEILVADRHGVVVAASNQARLNQKAPRYPSLVDWQQLSSLQKLKILLRESSDYELTRDIGAGGRKAFSIKVVVSTVLLRDALMPELTRLGLFGLLALSLALGLAALISRMALRPILRINELLDQIASGQKDTDHEASQATTVEELQPVESKLSLLGQQYRGALEDVRKIRRGLESLLESLEDVVLLFNEADELIIAGGPVERVFGKPGWSLAGSTLEELFPENSPLGAVVVAARELRRPLKNHPVKLEAHDGLSRQLLVSVEPLEVLGQGHLGTLIMLKDAEARQQIGSQLDFSARLLALNRLMGGLAHEIKNPLNAITLHLEILRGKLEQLGEDTWPELVIIGREIARLDRVVKTFLDFTRPVEPKLQELDLRDLIDQTCQLVKQQAAAHGIDIKVVLPESDALVQADADMLKQALLNVAINAVEAMSSGGTLTLRLFRDQSFWVIAVSDTGPGIPEEIQPKIFNLYFTTKKEGTGIGLAMAFRILQLHNGHIDFETKPGVGTTFFLHIPALGDSSRQKSSLEAMEVPSSQR